MGKKLKVLMVEDSAPVAGRIRSMLNETDSIFIVGEAANSREAAIILRTMLPDVVLISLNLSGKSGIKFLDDIRQANTTAKVIVLSNHSESYYRNLCMKSGADFFFDKSTEFEKIPAFLNSLQ